MNAGGFVYDFSCLGRSVYGKFAASLLGAPNVRVVEPTRSQAIEALKAEIEQRIQLGVLLLLEIDVVSVSSLAGKYATDPTLREICDTAYQLRDVERDQ